MPVIDLTNSRDYYPLLYQAAFLAGVIVLLIEGIRRKFSLSAWLIIIATAISFGILGSRLGTYNWDEWQKLIQTGALSNFGQKSAIGGIAFGVLGIFLIKKYLGIRSNITDAFAFFLPVIMFFQRIGCLCAGCCFGTPYSGFGSITYSGFSFIRDHHIQEGLINYNQINTTSVHAVPLYLMFISLFTIFGLLWAKNKLKKPGSLLVLSMISMGVGRFFVEFFRDPITNHAMGSTHWGLKYVQWIVLISISLGCLLFYWNEFKRTNSEVKTRIPNPDREIFISACLCFFIFKSRHFFTYPELVVLHIVIGIAIVEIIRQRVNSFRFANKHKLKLVPYFMAFSSIFLMSQTYHYRNWDMDSNKTQTIVTQNLVYKDLLQTQYPCLETEAGCMGPVCSLADTSKPMGPDYFNTNIGIDRYVKTNGNFNLNYGVIGQLEHYNHAKTGYNNFRFNAFPYFGIDGYKTFGFRAGLRMGNIYDGMPENNSTTHFLPAGRFWFGARNIFTLQVGIFDSDIAGPFNSILDFRSNINLSGLSKNKLGQLSLGFSLQEWTNFFYGQTEIYVRHNIALTPRFGMTYNSISGPGLRSKGFLGGIGLRYDLHDH